ncbi:MAG TPA: hypothetical protein VGW31_03655 [Hanamia sp.]|nr:hypothetical protein [Hanamia sp.]
MKLIQAIKEFSFTWRITPGLASYCLEGNYGYLLINNPFISKYKVFQTQSPS